MMIMFCQYLEQVYVYHGFDAERNEDKVMEFFHESTLRSACTCAMM